MKVYSHLFLMAASAIMVSGVLAADSPALLAKIEAAQRRLTTTEQQVANERQSLARQLNEIEREVGELRQKTAVARRLADERTLSLSQLESRLDSWQQQQVYQANLLRRFVQQHSANANIASRDPSEQLTEVINYSRQLEGFLFPAWRQSELTLPGGKIGSLPTLSVGPVTWYWNDAETRAGLASFRDDGRLQADLMLSASDSASIEKLRTAQEGDLVFDPTMSRALARQQNSETLVEHLLKGGLWVAPILFFALFAACIALVKVAQLWRLPRIIRFNPSVLSAAVNGTDSSVLRQVSGMQKRLVEVAQEATTARKRDDLLFVQLQEDKHRLDRWIGAIAITASVSPLLGLLGTVSGMIETFKMMTLFGSGDPEVVSGGIAQALVTTELGLVVAIPALLLNAVLSRKAKGYFNELESFAILLGEVDDDTGSNEAAA